MKSQIFATRKYLNYKDSDFSRKMTLTQGPKDEWEASSSRLERYFSVEKSASCEEFRKGNNLEGFE